MNNKALCIALSASLALTVAGCGKKAPDISGKYEGVIPVYVNNRDYGVKGTDAELPVYLVVGKDNTYTIDLGFRELTRDLYKVADDIEEGGEFIVKDVRVSGTDHYEGTVEYVDGKFVFSGDIDFVASADEKTLLADNLFGEKKIEFK